MIQHKRPRTAYEIVAREYDVSVEMVRAICGPIGQQTNVPFHERLHVLRGKMDAAGLLPAGRVTEDPAAKADEPDEPRPLRSCVLCENFLDEDDAGEPVLHSEEPRKGVVCQSCVAARLL